MMTLSKRHGKGGLEWAAFFVGRIVFRSPDERSDIRGAALASVPGYRFAHPGYKPGRLQCSPPNM
jgi:hypothetical protein